MFLDFRFCLGIVTTHLTCQCPKCLFHMEKLAFKGPLKGELTSKNVIFPMG